MFTVQVTSQIS